MDSIHYISLLAIIHAIHCNLQDMEWESSRLLYWIYDTATITRKLDVQFALMLTLFERMQRWLIMFGVVGLLVSYPTWFNAFLSVMLMQHVRILKMVAKRCVSDTPLSAKLILLQKYQTCFIGVASLWIIISIAQFDDVMRVLQHEDLVSLGVFAVLYPMNMATQLFCVFCTHVREGKY